jgi:transposase InsO family protein
MLTHGLEGLNEVSRRPRSNPEALAEDVVCRIVGLKGRHCTWGPRKIRELYERQWGGAPSESSFKRVLERAGMTEKRRVRKSGQSGRITSKIQAEAPNDVWTVDLKGWWNDPQGRCEPLTVRDEFSRFVMDARSLPNVRMEQVRQRFERLFEMHGLPAVIRSDNGTPFASAQGLLGLTKLSAWWLALGIDLERGRPGCPQDNGAHERMHRDLAREVQGMAYEGRQAALDVWRNQYNHERPHEALGMRCPAEVYESSPRKWQGTPDELVYEGMDSRKVATTGMIGWNGRLLSISAALAGWHVGLAPGAEGMIDVYFARLQIGQIEEASCAFIPARGAAPHKAISTSNRT